MEGDSGSVTAAVHGCRSAVGADCAPADAWSSSITEVSVSTVETLAPAATPEFMRETSWVAVGFAAETCPAERAGRARDHV